MTAAISLLAHGRLLARSALLAACTLLCASAMAADGKAATQDIEARYRSERAACDTNPAIQDREACRREAAAARDAAKHDQLSEDQRNYQQNALTRCNALPAAERDACVRRARGEGAVHGSVESGGLLREYREVILPPVAPQQNGAPAR